MEVCVLTVEEVKYGGMCINCGGRVSSVCHLCRVYPLI
mgnify:CR=1 FL=1